MVAVLSLFRDGSTRLSVAAAALLNNVDEIVYWQTAKHGDEHNEGRGQWFLKGTIDAVTVCSIERVCNFYGQSRTCAHDEASKERNELCHVEEMGNGACGQLNMYFYIIHSYFAHHFFWWSLFPRGICPTLKNFLYKT